MMKAVEVALDGLATHFHPAALASKEVAVAGATTTCATVAGATSTIHRENPLPNGNTFPPVDHKQQRIALVFRADLS
jgi:hypothetical protein